jgi:type II secretory ATPase GspE/PulE/Tfp pilus assembly ATPase PilB-like protein
MATTDGTSSLSISGVTSTTSGRDLSFEVSFYRKLQQVTTRIHDTENLDRLMLDVSQDICELLNADRLTLYAVSEDGASIISKVKTGINSSQNLKLPINARSIAGFVALKLQTLNIADVYDEQALARIDPQLSFLKEVDRRTGYRTHQMLAAPVMEGGVLYGVLQVINNRAKRPFGVLELEGVQQLCATLAVAIRQRVQKSVGTVATSVRATKYDGLIGAGLLSREELHDCIQTARQLQQPLEQLLMSRLELRPAQIGSALARFFCVPYVGFDSGRVRYEPLHGRVKREFVSTQGWLPLEDTEAGLLVMCLDPEAVQQSRLLPQLFPQMVKFVYGVTTQTEFEETLAQLYGGEGGAVSTIDDMLADMRTETDPLESGDEVALESAAADNELVKFVNKVIVDAYHQGASDIHIEPLPGKGKTGIRFRIDGALMPYIEVPAQFRSAMVTRLKIMCDLDISEKRKPQDGKIKFKKYGPLDIELRVATIPSAGGVEDVVMRILAAGEPIPLDKLGLTQHNRMRLEATISKPYGLFYVCGPTGSGKTTTLHSILKFLNTPETKIWTAEDPVEITQKGLRQVQVNKKAGIDFALVMRAFLRADPDIIMVGESRDKETVSMGVEASLTGHLVFSTLHTNSAPESILRLLDMGMDPFNFADALLGILAQRLARKLCSCKVAYVPDSAELRAFIHEYAQELAQTTAWKADPGGEAQLLLESWQRLYGQDDRLYFYRAQGCDLCRQTGYKGRIGLHELLIANDTLKQMIQERARVATLFAAALESGMRTLKMDGMEKVMQGLTDLKQVRAVCIK